MRLAKPAPAPQIPLRRPRFPRPPPVEGSEKQLFLPHLRRQESLQRNETKGRWCHISGKTDGELNGVAILDHPSNFRSPQAMRLNPSDPFFCFAPSQDGDWEIAP